MSKKVGGSISGNFGGGKVPWRGAGSNSKGPISNSNSNNGRNSHFKVVQSDAKYGMLMWQSKLQEKFLQEQKQKKETARRKSDEDYHRALALGTNTNVSTNTRTRRSSGGVGETSRSGRSDEPLKVIYNVGNPLMQSSESERQQGESGRERRIEILREPNQPELSFHGLSPSTPTSNPTLVVTHAEPRPQDIDFSKTSTSTKLFTSRGTGDTENTGADYGATNFNSSSNMGSQYYHNYYGGRNINTDVSRMGLSNNYVTDQPMFPKLVTKLNSSVSCDNIAKPQHTFGNCNLNFFGLNGTSSSGAGAGAPRRSPSGKVLTNLQGHPEIRYHQKDTRGFDQTLRYMMDKEKVHQYKEDLDKQLEEKQKWRTSTTSGAVGPIKIMSSHDQLEKRADESLYLGESGNGNGKRYSRNGIELAPLIRKYRSLPKLNMLSSTDVTKISPRKGDYCLSPEPDEVAKGLLLQLVEKQRIQQIQQENERLAAERHFNTWDSFWGRPGGGAPMFYSRNSTIGASTPSLATSRVDLFKALHMTHQKKPK